MKKEKFHKDTFDNTTSIRRKKVLDEAIAEFACKGYHATSINEIARNANISIGAMYSYFASKEDLFLSIVNDAYDLMNEILQKIGNESKDVFDCIRKMIAASRFFALEYPQLNQIYLDITTQALSSLSVRLSSKLEIITPHLLGEQLRNAKEAGLIESGLDEKIMAYCIDNIFMMYQFSFSSDYYKQRLSIYLEIEEPGDMEQIEADIYSFICYGIRKK